jgi:hypothetical protein
LLLPQASSVLALTRRETFELDLMEEGRSNEGTAIDLDEEDQHHDTK